MDNATYVKLSSAQIGDNKNLVISKCSKGGFTIAQQILADNNGKKMGMFIKGAIQISDANGLTNLRDSLNMAINRVENDNNN